MGQNYGGMVWYGMLPMARIETRGVVLWNDFFCDAQVPRVRLVGQAYLESNRVSDLAKNYVIPGGKTQYYRGRLNVLFCV